MAEQWTVVLKGDFWLPHLVNMLKEYKGNSEQSSCRDEMVAQVEAQITGGLTEERSRLVVIDPESDEDVQRLYDLYYRNMPGSGRDQMQQALREFASPTPPKPDEPTGLGAVVEDADGNRWVKWSLAHRAGRNWRKASAEGGLYETYADVGAVHVLSEGVS